MLAKNLNDNAPFLNERGACEFFASKLAPTKKPNWMALGHAPDGGPDYGHTGPRRGAEWFNHL